MNFYRYRDENGHIMITPINNGNDVLIFQHCSNGMVAVTEHYFKNAVAPLLRIHLDRKDSWVNFQFIDKK